MTNELGTTLDVIQAKAERKREALHACDVIDQKLAGYATAKETIRKYIEEN